MGLKCGIVGLSNVGKTTLFNCLSKSKAEAGYGAKTNLGIIEVPDQRLYELEKYQPAEMIVHATVEIFDIPGLTKGSTQSDSGGSKFLAEIRNTDAIIHVVQCFESDKVAHIEGSVDPVRDREIVDFELQLKDLETISKRMTKAEKAAKIGDKDAKKMLDLLSKLKSHIEELQNARSFDFEEEERKIIYDLFLLTLKPVLYVCNVDEKSAVKGNAFTQKFIDSVKGDGSEVLIIAAAAEAEIAMLEEADDREEFLKELGLTEPGVNKLVRSAYNMLDLQTFFTIGGKENRAWTIKKGMTAPQAAGVIHSDLERGFIRAEVIKYNDFIELKSENACKEKGKLYIMGKNYIVEDGDILHIRFNV